jgi:C1A family cysteine protease
MTKQRKATYLIERVTGKRMRLGGVLPSQSQPPKVKRKVTYTYKPEELPPVVDIRPFLKPLEDHSTINSCVANAIATAYEYLQYRTSGKLEPVSRLFLYYNARMLDGNEEKDIGSSISSTLEVIEKMGVCQEETWSYDPDLVDQKPHFAAYKEAKKNLVEQVQEIDIDLYNLKHCLAQGYPFIFSLQLFHSFSQAGNKGKVFIPDLTQEKSHADHGIHAMLCVGYIEKYQVFIVRNSWGDDWGDEGYCYIPYDYFLQSDYCQECWSLRFKNDLDFSEGVWFNTLGETIKENLDFLQSKDDEYEHNYYFEYTEDDNEELVEDEEEGYLYVAPKNNYETESYSDEDYDEDDDYYEEEEAYEYADDENYDDEDFAEFDEFDDELEDDEDYDEDYDGDEDYDDLKDDYDYGYDDDDF